METSKRLKDLIVRALEARLLFDELKKEHWLFENNSDAYSIIQEDLEEGVSHTPAFVITGKIDFKMWQSQYEYKVLVCDLHLLPYIEDSKKWIKMRAQLIERIDSWDEDTILNEINSLKSTQ